MFTSGLILCVFQQAAVFKEFKKLIQHVPVNPMVDPGAFQSVSFDYISLPVSSLKINWAVKMPPAIPGLFFVADTL